MGRCRAGLLPSGARGTARRIPGIAPALETAPVPSRGDDDPAIWTHHPAPERSLVVATDKCSGLLAYDLRGNQLQHLTAGNLNNVDLRTGAWGRADLTIVVASVRQPAELVVFELDHASGEIREVRRNDSLVDEPYGICLFLDEARRPWVVLNRKDGLFIQFELHADYRVTEARRWRTQTQPDGCVADDDTGVLYVGEEGHSVWTLEADPGATVRLTPLASIAVGALTVDIVRLILYRKPDPHGGLARNYLLVSSQGDGSFAVYDTDGIAATSAPPPGFLDGLLVVQDD